MVETTTCASSKAELSIRWASSVWRADFVYCGAIWHPRAECHLCVWDWWDFHQGWKRGWRWATLSTWSLRRPNSNTWSPHSHHHYCHSRGCEILLEMFRYISLLSPMTPHTKQVWLALPYVCLGAYSMGWLPRLTLFFFQCGFFWNPRICSKHLR